MAKILFLMFQSTKENRQRLIKLLIETLLKELSLHFASFNDGLRQRVDEQLMGK